MHMLEIAALYCGVNILLLMVLSFLVAMGRNKHKVLLGDGGNERLNRTIRVHGNAAEQVPAALVGLLALALFDPATPIWLLHAAGISLTAGRIFHAVGLSMGALNAGRAGGMLLTLLSYLLIGGGLIYVALSQQL